MNLTFPSSLLKNPNIVLQHSIHSFSVHKHKKLCQYPAILVSFALTLETSTLQLVTVANLHFQLS